MLSRAKTEDLFRFAKYLGIYGVCECRECAAKMVDKVVRHLDQMEE
jgi:hypothetical protein